MDEFREIRSKRVWRPGPFFRDPPRRRKGFIRRYIGRNVKCIYCGESGHIRALFQNTPKLAAWCHDMICDFCIAENEAERESW